MKKKLGGKKEVETAITFTNMPRKAIIIVSVSQNTFGSLSGFLFSVAGSRLARVINRSPVRGWPTFFFNWPLFGYLVLP